MSCGSCDDDDSPIEDNEGLDLQGQLDSNEPSRERDGGDAPDLRGTTDEGEPETAEDRYENARSRYGRKVKPVERLGFDN